MVNPLSVDAVSEYTTSRPTEGYKEPVRVHTLPGICHYVDWPGNSVIRTETHYRNKVVSLRVTGPFMVINSGRRQYEYKYRTYPGFL